MNQLDDVIKRQVVSVVEVAFIINSSNGPSQCKLATKRLFHNHTIVLVDIGIGKEELGNIAISVKRTISDITNHDVTVCLYF